MGVLPTEPLLNEKVQTKPFHNILNIIITSSQTKKNSKSCESIQNKSFSSPFCFNCTINKVRIVYFSFSDFSYQVGDIAAGCHDEAEELDVIQGTKKQEKTNKKLGRE